MTPEHLQEIRDAKLVRPTDFSEAMFHLGLAQGHRHVLLEAYDALAASVDRLTSDKARLAAELARIHKHDHIAELKDRIGALEAALSDLTYLHPDSNKWATAREHARTLVGSEPETKGEQHGT